MTKISKSDQDPHQTDSDRTALEALLSKKSQHFQPGTWVVRNGRRAQVIAVAENILHVYYEPDENGVRLNDNWYPVAFQWGKSERNPWRA